MLTDEEIRAIKFNTSRPQMRELCARLLDAEARVKELEKAERAAYERGVGEAAKVAEHYEPRCDVCPSGVTAAILALLEPATLQKPEA
jgi:hypothetical protein